MKNPIGNARIARQRKILPKYHKQSQLYFKKKKSCQRLIFRFDFSRNFYDCLFELINILKQKMISLEKMRHFATKNANYERLNRLALKKWLKL